jgi:hypothetical protein
MEPRATHFLGVMFAANTSCDGDEAEETRQELSYTVDARESRTPANFGWNDFLAADSPWDDGESPPKGEAATGTTGDCILSQENEADERDVDLEDEWELMALAFPTASTNSSTTTSSTVHLPVLLRSSVKKGQNQAAPQPWRWVGTSIAFPDDATCVSETSDTEANLPIQPSLKRVQHDSVNPAGSKIRRRAFAFALFLNSMAMALTLVSSLAASYNYHLLDFAPFAVGTARITSLLKDDAYLQETTLKVGLRAAGIQMATSANSVASHGTWCEMDNDHVGPVHFTNSCEACAAIGNTLTVTSIMALLFVVPSVLSNVARMTQKHDTLFQKLLGIAMGVSGFIVRYEQGLPSTC